MTIQSSKEVDGAVGMIAKACGSCCGTKWGQTTAAIVKVRVSQSVVVRQLYKRRNFERGGTLQ
jgi:hypothetical protein